MISYPRFIALTVVNKYLQGHSRWWGGDIVDGAEGAGSVDKLSKLIVTSLHSLEAEGASKSGAEGEGRARGVEVEDRAADDVTDVAGGEGRNRLS